MDPWNSSQEQQDTEIAVAQQSPVQQVSLEVDLQSTATLFFDDNFQPHSQPDGQKQPFVKLPDSQEYLASLEKKLSVIQKGGKKGSSASSILKSLSQTRESCMLNLLTNSLDETSGANIPQEEFIAEDLKVNLLLKKLVPEKQAISAEELIHLVKADQLEVLLSEKDEVESAETPTVVEDIVEKEQDNN